MSSVFTVTKQSRKYTYSGFSAQLVRFKNDKTQYLTEMRIMCMGEICRSKAKDGYLTIQHCNVCRTIRANEHWPCVLLKMLQIARLYRLRYDNLNINYVCM